jgi:hypothetical protein
MDTAVFGVASALALAGMIMAARLPLRLANLMTSAMP